MARYKLVEKHEHIFTQRRLNGGFYDWYILKCGHVVVRANTDMRREKCRCYHCAGEPYKNPCPPGLAAQVLLRIWQAGEIPIIE